MQNTGGQVLVWSIDLALLPKTKKSGQNRINYTMVFTLSVIDCRFNTVLIEIH